VAGPPWSENRTEELRRLIYDENLTDIDIARRLGLTRGQVTNKRMHEGWPAGSTLKKYTHEGSRNEAAEAIDPMRALPVQPVRLEMPHLPPPIRATGGEYVSFHRTDVHHPYSDPAVLSITYQLIRDLQPDLVVDHGDLLDCYAISRYEKDPHNRVSLQDEITMAALDLATITRLSPHSERWLLGGNHEDRLRRLLWSMAERQEAHQVLSLTRVRDTLQWPVLLDLAAIGWQWFESKQLLFDKLVVKHGSVVRKHGAYTAKGEYEKYGRSGMSGHTHRRGVYEHRDHNGHHAWWEIGCSCLLDPEYVDDPDWAQGLNVVTWSEDRKHYGVEEIRIHNGVAMFRGRMYVAESKALPAAA
jgi:hypothetical protein